MRQLKVKLFQDGADLGSMIAAKSRGLVSGYTYVKIPITNTKGESAGPLISKLSKEGFSLNVTAMLTLAQVDTVAAAASPSSRTIVSVFAGRIADTGVDPV